MMRAVWIGLVASVLVAGVAQAGPTSCPETKAVLFSETSPFLTTGEPTRADMIGKEWRVEKPRGRSRGWAHSVTLVSDQARIVVGQEINPGTTPAVGFASWLEGDRVAPVGRAATPQKVNAVGEYAYKISSGPLEGMRLVVSRCSE